MGGLLDGARLFMSHLQSRLRVLLRGKETLSDGNSYSENVV
jgi:hypothetical protein